MAHLKSDTFCYHMKEILDSILGPWFGVVPIESV
jgi:hypothetical protein